MRSNIILFLLLLILLPAISIRAQTRADSIPSKPTLYFLKPEILDGDTLPHVLLNEVTVMKPWDFKNRREYQRYHRLVRNIKVTLPYARMAAERLEVYNYEMSLLKTEKQRKAYLKEAEQELFAEFEAPLRKLTFSQGRLLIKLIDRET